LSQYKTCLFVVATVGVAATGAFGQAVPDSIVQAGVPAVQQDLVRDLARYQNTRAAGFQGWVNDRWEVLITTRFSDTNQVHHVRMPLGARMQVTFLAERILAARTRPGRDEFVYTTDEGGSENYQIVLQDLKTGETRRLTDGKSRNLMGPWSTSGTLLAWSSNARNGRDMDLYVGNPSNPKTVRLLKEASGNWTVSDWSPDDRRVAAVESVSVNESYVHLIDVATGKTETITPRAAAGEPTVAYGNVKWSKDGKFLYWTTDLDSEFQRLARLDPAAKTNLALTESIPWDIEGFDLSDDGGSMVLSANEGGVSRLYLLAGGNPPTPIPDVPPGVISGLKYRPKSDEFAFVLSSAQAPADVYSIEPQEQEPTKYILTRWTESETGGLDPSSFVEPELVRFPSFDGREITAFLYRPGPQFAGPDPVLINIHGGPEGQYRPAFLGRLNYLVNELGIALLFPNVRGSAGYGKSFLKLDNGKDREDAVKDIGALIDWVGKQPGLDASRVGVIGGSYGGYMTLATLTHYSDRLRAGIDIVGISNFVTFLKNTQGYRRDLRRVEYGDERDESMRSFLERISPLTNAAKIKVPLLVVQGRNDPRVPKTEAEQIVAAVRKQGGPVWYVEGKDEGHGFAKKRNQDYLQYAEILFLKRYLLGEVIR
jgi:dipeptidyl aminopeptidase/acylaminoacyl peptidase